MSARNAPGARPLRIVYLWDADYPWDVRTEKVCAALTAAGHEVHIVARNKAWRAEREPSPAGTVHRMRPWRWLGKTLDNALGFPAFFSPRWYRLLDRVVRAVRADVIVARDVPLLPTAVWVGRRRGVPVVNDMAENYPAVIKAVWEAGRAKRLDLLVRNPRAVAAVERWCLPHLARILVVAEENGERLVRLGVPRERIVVVYNTPPRARAEAPPAAAKPDAPIDVVYLGLLEIPRGIGELIEAAALLRGSTPPVRVRLVGAGRDMALFQRQAADRGLGPDAVEFLGFVENAAAQRVVAAAHIGANPLHDGEKHDSTIPNKLFDYMAAAVPVLTSSSAPSARVTREAGAGVVFRSRDAAACAEGIRALLDPETRRRCGEAGRRAVLETYHWERDVERLVAAVEGAAAEGPPAAR